MFETAALSHRAEELRETIARGRKSPTALTVLRSQRRQLLDELHARALTEHATTR